MPKISQNVLCIIMHSYATVKNLPNINGFITNISFPKYYHFEPICVPKIKKMSSSPDRFSVFGKVLGFD